VCLRALRESDPTRITSSTSLIPHIRSRRVRRSSACCAPRSRTTCSFKCVHHSTILSASHLGASFWTTHPFTSRLITRLPNLRYLIVPPVIRSPPSPGSVGEGVVSSHYAEAATTTLRDNIVSAGIRSELPNVTFVYAKAAQRYTCHSYMPRDTNIIYIKR
jgi:hypothetical protein